MAFHIEILITSFIVLLLNNTFIIAWGGNDKVLLKDIDVLTLYNGKMTKGSRSSPVPQLECVEGGTAPCNTFKPRVVQCYNRGSDGADVQWECKTDMDNAYRFGNIEVSCEGYNYPDDPYVLKGSCGLRYNIDYTMEGHQQKKQHNYYGDSQSSSYYGSNDHSYYNTKSSKSWNFADIIVLGAVALMIYAFYVTCIRPSRHVGDDANSTTNEDYPSGGGGGGYGWHNPTAPPPPGSGGGGGGGTYGFNPDYTSGASCAGGARNRSNHSSSAGGASGSGGGGFWTGAATGGLLGYMFGNRGNNRGWGGGATGYGGRGFGGGGFGGSGFGGGGFSRGGGGFSGGSSSSSGTRSSSGFGGTSRR